MPVNTALKQGLGISQICWQNLAEGAVKHIEPIVRNNNVPSFIVGMILDWIREL